jgi:hypothetical protein
MTRIDDEGHEMEFLEICHCLATLIEVRCNTTVLAVNDSKTIDKAIMKWRKSASIHIPPESNRYLVEQIN